MKKLLSMILLPVILLSTAAAAETGVLPPFEYTGGDPYTAAICAWLLESEAEKYASGDVAIPCPLILEVDDSDKNDVLVWGIFGLEHYDLLNTTLLCVSGGNTPGLLHLKAEDGAYTVTAFDAVGSGTDYTEDIQRIFGMKPDLIRRLAESYGNIDLVRLQFISDYVNHNMLSVTQMQDFGWPPVPLINAPDTPDEEQIIHYASPLGYAMDYDLRQFSFYAFDESMDVFSGVGELEGISISVQRLAITAGEAASALEAEMESPLRENVSAGNTQALSIRDASLRPDVHKIHYIVPAGDCCLLVSASNTYYSTEGDPVVPGADSVIEATLASFQLS